MIGRDVAWAPPDRLLRLMARRVAEGLGEETMRSLGKMVPWLAPAGGRRRGPV